MTSRFFSDIFPLTKKTTGFFTTKQSKDWRIVNVKKTIYDVMPMLPMASASSSQRSTGV